MKKGLMIILFTAAICCCVLGIYMTMDSRITEPAIDEDASLLIKDKVTKDDAAEEESQETAEPEHKSAEEIAKNLELIVTGSMLDNGFDESQVGIVVHDYVTDAVYAVNADSYFTAGSTYKVPLAMLYYEKLALASSRRRTGFTTMRLIMKKAGRSARRICREIISLWKNCCTR